MRHLIAILTLLCLATPSAAATYEIDPIHTSVVFKVRHLGVSSVYGRFNDVAGTVTLDEGDVAKSRVVIEIQAASVDTNVEKRDTHLRGPDFFSVREFPTIRFESTAVEKTGDDTYEVRGNVSFHGATKPLTAQFSYFGEAQDSQGKTKGGGEATFTVKRSEFGVTYGIPAIGDDVVFTVGIEAYKQ